MRLEFEPTTVEESGIVTASENTIPNNLPDIRELLRKGINAAQAGNRSEARAFLQSVVEADPKNENAWLWLASISEYPEELMVFLENVLEVNPQNKRAAEWMSATKSLLAKTFVQRGIDAVESGLKDFASDCFNSALEHDQNNAMAWLWMASLCEENEGKMAYLERVLAIEPENETAKREFDAVRVKIVESQFLRAKGAAVSGNLKDAVEELSAVLQEAPELEEAWIFKSHIVDTFQEKILTLEEGLVHHPESLLMVSSLASLKAIVASAAVAVVTEEVPEQTTVAEVVENEYEMHVDADEELVTDEPSNEFVEYFAEDLSAQPLSNEVSSPWDDVADDEQTGMTETHFAPQDDHSVSFVVQEDPLQFDTATEIEMVNETAGSEDAPFASYVSTGFGDISDEEIALTPNEAVYQSETELELPALDVVDTNVANLEKAPDEVPAEAADYPMEVEQPPVYVAEDLNNESEEVIMLGTQAVYEQTDHTDDLPQMVSPVEAEMSGNEEVLNSEIIYPVDASSDHSEYTLAEDNEMEFGIPQPPTPFADPEPVKTGFETTIVREEVSETPVVQACPYCSTENDAHNYVCNLCMSVLTLSDLELLIANQNADHSLVRPVIQYLEEERQLRQLTENELTTIGIGYLNLQTLDKGYEALLEASRSNPNNVVLSSHVNSLHIRMEEIKKQNEAQESMVRGKKIMVVDDSPTIRKLISGKLEKTGHIVHTAADGLEAVTMIDEIMPDLILLDITMPKMDGYQVCKAIRSNQNTMNIPVVMISGKDGFFDKVRGRMAGTSGYITKPFGPETLMKAVETYLSNGHVQQAETGELQLSQTM